MKPPPPLPSPRRACACAKHRDGFGRALRAALSSSRDSGDAGRAGAWRERWGGGWRPPGAESSPASRRALLCGAGPVSEPAWGGAGREGRAGRYHEHPEGPPVRALRVSPPVHHLGRHVLDGAAERVGPLVVVDGLLAQPEIWGRTAHSSAQSCSVWGWTHAEPHGGGLWCHLRRPACRGVTSPPALPGPHAPHDAGGSPRLPGAPGDFPIGLLQPSAGAPCKGTKRLNCLGTNRSPREAGRDREAGVPLDGTGRGAQAVRLGGEAGRV